MSSLLCIINQWNNFFTKEIVPIKACVTVAEAPSTATLTLVACHSYTAALHAAVLLPNSTHALEDSKTK